MNDFKLMLRAEIGATQERRSALIRQKLTYVIGAFGLGALSSDTIPTSNLFFLAPVIAFVFDLYIAGDDFGVKRAGAFLGGKGSQASSEEKAWEERCNSYRDPFSRIAWVSLSLVVLVASAWILWSKHHENLLYQVWLGLNILLIVGIWVASIIMNRRLRKYKEEIPPKENVANSSDE